VSAAVVDTSAWIDYFAGRDVPLLDAALKQSRLSLAKLASPYSAVRLRWRGGWPFHACGSKRKQARALQRRPWSERADSSRNGSDRRWTHPPQGDLVESRNREVKIPNPYPAAFALASTGNPASCQAAHPPVSARAFFHPACLSSCATRALVASFVQAQ
jgi:hypothetical protein